MRETLSMGEQEMPTQNINRACDAATPILDVPVIDLRSCFSSDHTGKKQELEKLRSALTSCGFVQLRNHGMTNSFLDQVHEIGKQFFALPMEEKLKYSDEAGQYEGYLTYSESQALDAEYLDRLLLQVQPEDQRKLSLWPRTPQSFRELLEEYIRKIKSLHEAVLKAMAESLGLGEKRFLEQYGERPSMHVAFNFYPPSSSNMSHLNLGKKPHTDPSPITILLQDNQVNGLQVLKDDQWFQVPTVPHTFLVNIGDQIEIMSNGVFKSPMHKVMKNSRMERMTIAMFCLPESDREIGPVEELISEDTPRLYKNIAHYTQLLRKPCEKGKRPIDEMKL